MKRKEIERPQRKDFMHPDLDGVVKQPEYTNALESHINELENLISAYEIAGRGWISFLTDDNIYKIANKLGDHFHDATNEEKAVAFGKFYGVKLFARWIRRKLNYQPQQKEDEK